MTSATGGGVESLLVTRAEYLESGSLASRKKLLDWKSAEDLESAIYEKFSGEPDLDGNLPSHTEKDIGAGASTVSIDKERDRRKDRTGTKGPGKTRTRRDEQQGRTPRVDDPSSQVENHQASSVGGRLTRARSGMAGISK